MHKYGHIPCKKSCSLLFSSLMFSQSDAFAIQASARSCSESTWWQSESLAQRSPWPFPPRWGQETLSNSRFGTSRWKKHEHVHTYTIICTLSKEELVAKVQLDWNEGTTHGWIQRIHFSCEAQFTWSGATWYNSSWGQPITGTSDDHLVESSHKKYPLGINIGVLENGPLISDSPIKPPFIEDFPASHVWLPEGTVAWAFLDAKRQNNLRSALAKVCPHAATSVEAKSYPNGQSS